MCEVAKADIICVVETWLNSDIANNYGWITISYIGGVGIGMVVALLCTHLTPLCVNLFYLVALTVWNLDQFLFPQLYFLKSYVSVIFIALPHLLSLL